MQAKQAAQDVIEETTARLDQIHAGMVRVRDWNPKDFREARVREQRYKKLRAEAIKVTHKRHEARSLLQPTQAALNQQGA